MDSTDKSRDRLWLPQSLGRHQQRLRGHLQSSGVMDWRDELVLHRVDRLGRETTGAEDVMGMSRAPGSTGRGDVDLCHLLFSTRGLQV